MITVSFQQTKANYSQQDPYKIAQSLHFRLLWVYLDDKLSTPIPSQAGIYSASKYALFIGQ